MDCSLPGSSIHGIFQARILESVAISSPRWSSWPRDRTRVFCTAGRFFTVWAPGKPMVIQLKRTSRDQIPTAQGLPIPTCTPLGGHTTRGRGHGCVSACQVPGIFRYYLIYELGLPWWLSDKESISHCRRHRFDLQLGRSSGVGNGNPLQYSCLGNPMDRGAWQATVHGVAKSQMRLSNWAHKIHDLTRLSVSFPL